MNIAICDDEREYRKLLEKYVLFYFSENKMDVNCWVFDNGNELLSSKQHFDIAFLDIEMDNIDGIEITKQINTYSRSSLIFIVTAYQHYLDDAMDLNVFRYINKPIIPSRIYDSLDKAIVCLNQKDIVFKTKDNSIVSIPKYDIIYIEVSHKKVFVQTIEELYIARERMDFFRENLTNSYFVVPHNSYIVNLGYVTNYKRESLILNNKYTISIAPKRQSETRQKFITYMGDDYGNLSNTI